MKVLKVSFYGECLHKYIIKEAICDEALLGFMIEILGNNKVTDPEFYHTKQYMRAVLDVVLNKSITKLDINNFKGKSYVGILTVDSIPIVQKYYKLLKQIKSCNDKQKIEDQVLKMIPDFPKFAITYSVTENNNNSLANQ